MLSRACFIRTQFGLSVSTTRVHNFTYVVHINEVGLWWWNSKRATMLYDDYYLDVVFFFCPHRFGFLLAATWNTPTRKEYGAVCRSGFGVRRGLNIRINNRNYKCIKIKWHFEILSPITIDMEVPRLGLCVASIILTKSTRTKYVHIYYTKRGFEA